MAMREADLEPKLDIIIGSSKEAKDLINSAHPRNVTPQETTSTDDQPKDFKWCTRVAIYSACVLCGQSVATLLGRLYFDKGGRSQWVSALGLIAGFPLLLPFYLIPTPKRPNFYTRAEPPSPSSSSLTKLACVYIFLGTFVAVISFLYAVGLKYLPVSTYSLISASQLGFNVIFSFFLNSQKFTPLIINSTVLLTISSVLLVFQTNSENPDDNGGVPKAKYAVGFMCTIAASAGYGLGLSLTQLVFTKVIQNENFRAVLDLIVWESVVGTAIIVVGLFVSGDWRHWTREMDEYELGKACYVMNLVGTAICWEVFSIGTIGLIFDVSSLFSNSISVVGLPIVPIFAVVFFHDKMDGVKVMAMVLAIWGFISYVYQHCLDESKLKSETTNNVEDDQLI